MFSIICHHIGNSFLSIKERPIHYFYLADYETYIPQLEEAK
jgi:hypothetical protein